MITSLDNPIVKLRRVSRVKTILEAGFLKYKTPGRRSLKFLTLTSSDRSPSSSIHKSCRELFRLIKLKYDSELQYVKIRTQEGYGVLHLLIWSTYIPQSYISRKWELIHKAQIVDIRKVKMTKYLKNYLTPYLQGQATRISSSRNWIYQGWRKEYRRIGVRLYWHYLPALIRVPFCGEAYIKKLYYFYKQDILINSLLPLNRF